MYTNNNSRKPNNSRNTTSTTKSNTTNRAVSVNRNTTTKPWAPKPEKTQTKTAPYGNTTRKNLNAKGFVAAMKETQDNIYTLNALKLTENGALGYATSGSKLLDLNFAVSSLRGVSDKEIYTKFRNAYSEDPVMAMRWLFYCRDAREGLGERNIFRVCIVDLAKNGLKAVVNELIPDMAEYGRWDDILCLLDTPSKMTALKVISNQLNQDMKDCLAGKSISLLAKWMPSEQASNAKVKEQAAIITKYLKVTPRTYRQMLSKLRKYLDVVERKMSSDNWQAIDYEKVPSKANLNYNNAFLRHDEERRRAYLGALEKGEAKINSSVAFPHDIVHKYVDTYGWSLRLHNYDAALEGMWKALPDLVNGEASTLVVADGSGSMCTTIGNSKVTALEVANALAIYFAERCSGPFKNTYITFSSKPQIVNLGNGFLKNKLEEALKHDECANTNVEAVFDLVLKTAIEHRMSQDELPKNILILSDMEFDACAVTNAATKNSYWGWSSANRPTKTLFENIAARFEEAGYKMPRLVFWNLNSRTGTIPVRENDLGVALVSGFSPNICKMVMSGQTDPYLCLVETLKAERYDRIEAAMRKYAPSETTVHNVCNTTRKPRA